MRLGKSLMVILALFCATAAAGNTPQSSSAAAARCFQQGLNAIRLGDFTKAEGWIKAGLTLSPNSAVGYDLLGVAEDGLGHVQGAEQAYRRALAINPAFLGALNDLGRNLYQQGKVRAAAHEFKLALKIRPEDFTANYNYGIILLKARNFSQAAAYLEAAHRQAKSDPETVIALANCYLSAGQMQRAKALADKFAAGFSGDARVPFSLGTLFLKWRDYREAARLFESARASAPENFALLFDLGQVYTHLGRYSEAEDAFLKALSMQNDSVDTLYQLGVLYSQSGHADQAIRVLVRAREIAPGRPDILLLLSRVLMNQGFFEDAVDVLENCVKLNAAKVEPYLLLGEALTREKQFQNALDQYEEAEKLDPDNPQAQVGIGRSLLYMGRDSDAALALHAALKHNPDNPGADYYLGLLSQRHADYPAARSWFQQVLRSDPHHLGALYEMAVIYEKQHDWLHAAQYFQRARTVSPTFPETYYRLAAVYRRLGNIPEADKSLALFKKYSKAAGNQQRDYPPGLLDFVAKTQNLPQRERLERYRQALLRAEQRKPDDVNVLFALARIDLSLGQKREAMAWLGKISALRPHDAGLQLRSASLLSNAHCFPEAEKYLRTILNEQPGRDEARLELATIFYQTYRDSEALKTLLAADGELKQTAAYHDLLGQVLDQEGDSTRSVQEFQRAVMRASGDNDYIVDLALELMSAGRMGSARKLIERAITRSPTSCKLLFAQGIWDELEHHWKAANQSFLQAASLSWRWEPAYLAQMNVLGQIGSASKKLEVLNQVESLFPSSPWPHLFAAVIFTPAASNESVTSELNQALTLAPNEPGVYPALLFTTVRRHDCEKAREVWDQMARFGFGNNLNPVRWCGPEVNTVSSVDPYFSRIPDSYSVIRLLMRMVRATPAD